MVEPLGQEQLEQLVERIEPGGRLVRTWQLKGGISARMTALEIVRRDGEMRKLVVRQPPEWVLERNPRAARDEFQVLQIVRSMGIPTAAPHELDETGDLLPLPYLIVDYVEGRPQ